MKVLKITVRAECLSEAMSTLVAKTSEVFSAIDQQNSKHPDNAAGKITKSRKSVEWEYYDEAKGRKK